MEYWDAAEVKVPEGGASSPGQRQGRPGCSEGQPRGQPSKAAKPLSADDVKASDGFWRASIYLAVGQIYLRGTDQLLTEPLKHDDVRPGCWDIGAHAPG